MAQAIPTPLFHTEPGSQNAPSQLDIAKMETPTGVSFDAGESLRRGLQVGGEVAGGIIKAEELEKARRFEKVLKAGLPAMQETLQEMENEGYDLTGVPDPQLFLKSTDSMASWYQKVKEVKDKQDKLKRRGTQAGLIAEGKGDEAIKMEIEEDPSVDLGKGVKAFDTQKKARDAREGVAQLEDFKDTITVNKKLLDTIVDKEGGSAGYLAFNAGKSADRIGQSLPEGVTIGEIRKHQALPKGHPDRWFAVGGIQIIPETLEEVLKEMPDVTDDTVFTPELQQRMFAKLAKGKDVMELAKTWAAIGVPEDTVNNKGVKIKKGQSYYSGQGKNKAGISPETVQEFLDAGEDGIDITITKNPSVREQYEQMINAAVEGNFASDPEFQAQAKLVKGLLDADTKKEAADAKAKGKIKKLDPSLIAGINSIIALAKDVPPGKGFVARATGAVRSFKAWLGEDEDTKNLADFRRGLAAKVARGVSGEGSRLTDKDIDRALVMIPSQYDTIPERNTKIAVLQGLSTGEFVGKTADEVYAEIGLKLAEAARKAGEEGQSVEKPVDVNQNQSLAAPTDEEIDAMSDKELEAYLANKRN